MDGRLSWPWVAGWLHTEINVRHRELNPDTVAHVALLGYSSDKDELRSKDPSEGRHSQILRTVPYSHFYGECIPVYSPPKTV